MKGTFTYSNQLLEAAVVLIGTIGTSVISVTVSPFLFFPLLMLMIILLLAASHIPGGYTADSHCLIVKTLLKNHRFSYSQIQSVETELRHLGNSRLGDTFLAAAVLTIRTKNGEHAFRSNHYLSIGDQLNDPAGYKKSLDELDFMQLGRYIEPKIESSAEIAEQTE